MRKRGKTYLFAAAALTAVCLYGAVNSSISSRKQGEILAESEYSISLEEERYIYKERKEKISDTDIHIHNSVCAGDILYDAFGYKIAVLQVYENKIVLKNEGGLIPANEKGNMDIRAGSKDTYEVWRGEALTLRSFSMNKGVILKISYE